VARAEFREALEQLIEIVRRDRTFGEDVGRVRMLEIFDMASGDAGLVAEFRKRLSQVLF
jgi:putative thioredoxin